MEQKPFIPKARLRRLNIRLSQQEWDKVHKLSSSSTCRSVSDYARKVLSEKPVKVFYRNRSFDEFEEQMIILLPRLEAFGESFDQLVKKIPYMTNYPYTKEMLSSLLEYGREFSKTAGEIKLFIEKLANDATQNNVV
jgi:hypothetical protein